LEVFKSSAGPIIIMNFRSIVIALLIVLPLISSVSQAATLDSWNVEISLNDDGSADWSVFLNYSEPVSRSDYWVFGRIDNVKVSASGRALSCKTELQDVGTAILCDKADSKTISYKFKMLSASGTLGPYKNFKYDFSITGLVGKFDAKISLPLGAVLLDKEKLKGTPLKPYEPDFGVQGTDGRIIFIQWQLIEPKIGESLRVNILYESVIPFELSLPSAIIIIIIIIATASFLAYFLIFKRKPHMEPEEIIKILTPNERTIIQLLIEHQVLDQADIVRETKFSKAKVSRIIQSLQARNIINVVEKGRVNEVSLAAGRKFGKQPLSRAQINDTIKILINPWLEHLNKEIDAAKDLGAKQAFKPDIFKELKVLSKIQRYFNYVRETNPEIENLLAKHNRKVLEINREVFALRKMLEKWLIENGFEKQVAEKIIIGEQHLLRQREPYRTRFTRLSEFILDLKSVSKELRSALNSTKKKMKGEIKG